MSAGFIRRHLYTVIALLVVLILISAPFPAPAQQNGKTTAIVSITKNFAPYHWVDESGKLKGFALDVAKEIQKISGLTFEYKIFDGWEPALQSMRERKSDVLISIGITPKRGEYLDFTRPYETLRISHFIRKSTVDIETAADLAERKVGVIRVNRGRTLLEASGHSKLVVFEGLDQALFALLSGEVDSVAYPETIAWKAARAAGIDPLIKPIGPPLLEVKRAIGVAKGKPELLAKLDAAVATFIASDAYRRLIAKWFGTPKPFWNSGRVAIAGAVLAVIFMIGFLVYRNRAVSKFNLELRGTISAKDEAEAELREMHTNLENLVAVRTQTLEQEISERERVAAALSESEESYRTLLSQMHDGVIAGYEGSISFSNDAATQITGYGAGEMTEMGFDALLMPESRQRVVQRRLNRGLGKDVPDLHQLEFLHKDGNSVKICLVNVRHFQDNEGKEATLATFKDITDLKRAEAELHHAQKMEVLGNLTGGTAHSLNNLLVPIVGLGQMLHDGLPENSSQREMTGVILEAAESSRELVARMLTFSRQDDPQMELVDLCKITKKTLDLLKKSIPTTITIDAELDENIGATFADPAQVETVLMNLITNAADAINGNVGTVKVTLSRAEPKILGDEKAKMAFEFIKMSVSDSGSGMSDDVRERIFDPFFTTKNVGEGTGLGLATVYGLVRQHNGMVNAYSEVGKGTTF
ncbi:MAG: transporter substrate-binding domain-containing protein, partial [Rhodospirillales bacterium]|nr:transporter substrate-binding domain-containing protein [Rhodospirillales bacterium]